MFVGTYRSHSVHQGRSVDESSLLEQALSEAQRYNAHTISLDFPSATFTDDKAANDKHSDLRRARSFVISHLRRALPMRYKKSGLEQFWWTS